VGGLLTGTGDEASGVETVSKGFAGAVALSALTCPLRTVSSRNGVTLAKVIRSTEIYLAGLKAR